MADSRAAPAEAPAGEAQAPAVLNERFEILPQQGILALDGAAGRAFAVRLLKGRKGPLYALICSGRVPLRMEPLTVLGTLDSASLAGLVDWGVVHWTPERRHRLALIFDRPQGPPLMAVRGEVVEPMGEEALGRLVLQPVVSALKVLHARGLAHGGVRPTNLFRREGASGPVMLGECVSALPGYAQPVLYEPLERAMAEPGGRGPGSVADDLFALGVTVLSLLLGREPIVGYSDEEIIGSRLERGSFAALALGQRLSATASELVRGLLNDDPQQRWGLAQVDQWLGGRRLTPKQGQLPKRSARALEVAGRECWHCRGAAMALAANPPQALSLLDNGELDRWLRRSLTDDNRAELVAAAARSSQDAGKPATASDRLVARVVMALDPAAPIRYRGRSVMPDGIGGALADSVLGRDGAQIVAEMVVQRLPVHWLGHQTNPRPEMVAAIALVDGQRALLDKVGPGFGLERLLYELHPNLPCLSPPIADRFALSAIDVLVALDAVSGGRDRPREPIDRHVAAFLMARERKLDENMVALLATGAPPVRHCIAVLALLTEIQLRHGSPPLPGLCAWMVTLVEPAIGRFLNRVERDKVRRRVELAVPGGLLVDILRAVDDPQTIREDRLGFEAARRDHRRLSAEIGRLRQRIAQPKAIEEKLGRVIAAAFAGVAGCVIIGIMVMYYLTR